MQRTQARKEQVQEERRAAILAAEAAAERRLQQKHEVQKLPVAPSGCQHNWFLWDCTTFAPSQQ
jgi:hypothetical protein